MTERSTGRTTRLRNGSQEVLQSRTMEADPAPLAPQLHTDTAHAAQSGGYPGDVAFSHGGRREPAMAGPADGAAAHTELPGHRHRGAERHSAH
ncbi:hypothetical protein [Kitasatospora cheerisanensis]|uniref:Uncharacterized protein n=1 Tax=Kitasatospora cheerisanensis KCTC 2395 TaxID=1348663 RepID=A0A066Z2U4_9ACTN|nr:hypothetical protein [Kitasatospora cheerisanensis]KDN84500.1 hypothetical protein KCH_35920 [Kitasatospora cheerisanensis KCTC 2395]